MIFKNARFLVDGLFASINAIYLIRKAAQRDYFLLLFAIVGQALSLPVMFLCFKYLMETLQSSVKSNAWPWAIGEIISVLLLATFRQQVAYRQEIVREKLIVFIREQVNEFYSTMPYSKFDDPTEYDNLCKIRNNVYTGPLWIVISITSILRELSTFLIFLLLMALIDSRIVLFSIFALLPTIFLSQNAGYMSYSLHDLSTRDGRKSAYFDEVLTSKEYAKEVRLFDLSAVLNKSMKNMESQLILNKKSVFQKKYKTLLQVELIIIIAQYIPVIYGLYLYLGNFLNLSTFIYLSVTSTSLRMSTTSLSSHISSLVEQSSFFEYYRVILTKQKQPSVSISEIGIRQKDNPPEIRFENVSFSYPDSQRKVLDDLSFVLPAGKTTALVGANGSGKSTIVKLLCRLYLSTSGEIKIDNVNITSFPINIYQKKISIVFQDFSRYSFDFSENISVADQFNLQHSKMIDVIDASDLSKVICQYPKGINTPLGREFDESGVELSGGQWQKVAIARALYVNSNFFVMDEPTSALDIATEIEIFNHYAHLVNGKTSLIVTHRFSTVRFADNIIVIEDGKIVEMGSWEELLDRKGQFYDLYNKQIEMMTNPNLGPKLSLF